MSKQNLELQILLGEKKTNCNLMSFENYISQVWKLIENKTAGREKKMQPNFSEGVQFCSCLRNPDSDSS